MAQPISKFQEEFSAKLPALTLLTHLGWSFLSPEKALSARNGKADEVVLRQVLFSRADSGLLGGDQGPTMPGPADIIAGVPQVKN